MVTPAYVQTGQLNSFYRVAFLNIKDKKIKLFRGSNYTLTTPGQHQKYRLITKDRCFFGIEAIGTTEFIVNAVKLNIKGQARKAGVTFTIDVQRGGEWESTGASIKMTGRLMSSYTNLVKTENFVTGIRVGGDKRFC